MSKKQKNQGVFREMINQLVAESSYKVSTLLANERHEEFGDLPQEIVAIIHNVVLFNALCLVNFPAYKVRPADTSSAFESEFTQYAVQQVHLLSSFCKALSEWTPGAETTASNLRGRNGKRNGSRIADLTRGASTSSDTPQ
jgi:hypothetical protein